MKLLLFFLLLVSAARADTIGITGGQMYVFENEYFQYTYNTFKAPGYSLTYVWGDAFFDASGGQWPERCNAGCSMEQLRAPGSTLIYFDSPAWAMVNGVPTELGSTVEFHTTSFKSSLTPDGLTVSGFASGSGWFSPCEPSGDCLEETKYVFNPDQRWSYKASFHVYKDVPSDYPYFVREVSVTPVPELDSFVLTLIGMGGLGFFRRWLS